MSELPELIAVASRPIIMIAVAAGIYKIGKFLLATDKAAALSLSLTTTIFLAELFSIRIPALRLASMVSTLVGVAALALIFWQKRERQG